MQDRKQEACELGFLKGNQLTCAMMYQIVNWRPSRPMPERVSRMQPSSMMDTVQTDPHLPGGSHATGECYDAQAVVELLLLTASSNDHSRPILSPR